MALIWAWLSKYALAGAGVFCFLLLMWVGVLHSRLNRAEDETAKVQQEFDHAREQANAAALQQNQLLQAQKQAHDVALTKANDEASVKIIQATSDAASAVDAGNRLRARLAAALAARRPSASDITTPRIGPSESASSVYSDLFSETVGLAQQYAAIADAALVAGEQCQASYPVNPSPVSP